MITLVEARPADPATGAAVPVRLAGGGTRAFDQFGRVDWLAGVAGPPRFSAAFAFEDGGWTGGVVPQSTPIVFSPAEPATLVRLARYYWRDAPVSIWTAPDDGAPGEPLTGTVAAMEIGGGAMTLTVSLVPAGLTRALIVDRFKGTGGAEGDEEAEGREKRRSWGRVCNVAAQLLRKASNIYEVGDPSRPLQGITIVRDKGRAGPLTVLAWQGSIAATLAALAAAAVPRGGAVVAPSIACVRWWTKPAGPLTVDLLGEIGAGYVESAPEIAARIAAAAGGIAIEDLAAVVALRPAPAGIHVVAGETVAQVLDRLLLCSSLLWLVSPAGALRVLPWAFGASAAAIGWTPGAPAAPAWSAEGAAPQPWAPAAGSIERLRTHGAQRGRTFAPIRSRRVGYRRNHRPQDDGEIAADILYEDGTSIDDLKPAEGGADVTGDHTADDTAHIGGEETAAFIARVVNLEDVLAPEGEIDKALIEIREAGGKVEERVDTVELQLSGDEESYFSKQLALGFDGATALAKATSTLNAKVNGPDGLDAKVKQQSGTLAKLSGRTLAYWQVEASAGSAGTDAFVTVRAETDPDEAPTSSVAIGARTFMVYNQASGLWLKTLDVSGGNVRIYGNLAVDGSVTTRNIVAGAVTQSMTFSAPDVLLGSGETLLIETPAITLGDLLYGAALAVVFLTQDGTDQKDSGMTVRTYVDWGGGLGYQLVRDHEQRVRSTGGDTFWVLPVSFPLALASTKPIRVKVTGTRAGGDGPTYVRDILIGVLGGKR